MRRLAASSWMVLSIGLTVACGGGGSSEDGSGGTAGAGGGSGGSAGSGGSGGDAGSGGSAGAGGSSGGAGGMAGVAGMAAGGTAGMAGMPMLAPPPDYSTDDGWICLPGGADDTCTDDLDMTVWEADGTMTIEAHVPAANPAADCFYVYPTVSIDETPNADLDAPEERDMTRAQAARLTEVCRVYAPLYRQVTFFAPDRTAAGAIAYGDVLDSWNYYLANLNAGRPVVLLGHSQGAGHLRRLIIDEIDGNDTVRAQLVSAYLLGASIAVPDAQGMGGDFQNVPVCTDPTDVGCLVTYGTYLNTKPPTGAGPITFGMVRGTGEPAGCTNPGALGGGKVPLTSIFTTAGFGNLTPDQQAMITTPFVKMPAMVEAECAMAAGYHYLELTMLSDAPSDPRPDELGGGYILGDDSGFHVVDMHVAMGELIELVGSQIGAFTTP